MIFKPETCFPLFYFVLHALKQKFMPIYFLSKALNSLCKTGGY